MAGTSPRRDRTCRNAATRAPPTSDSIAALDPVRNVATRSTAAQPYRSTRRRGQPVATTTNSPIMKKLPAMFGWSKNRLARVPSCCVPESSGTPANTPTMSSAAQTVTLSDQVRSRTPSARGVRQTVASATHQRNRKSSWATAVPPRRGMSLNRAEARPTRTIPATGTRYGKCSLALRRTAHSSAVVTPAATKMSIGPPLPGPFGLTSGASAMHTPRMSRTPLPGSSRPDSHGAGSASPRVATGAAPPGGPGGATGVRPATTGPTRSRWRSPGRRPPPS
jgi:hypothetical protein